MLRPKHRLFINDDLKNNKVEKTSNKTKIYRIFDIRRQVKKVCDAYILAI